MAKNGSVLQSGSFYVLTAFVYHPGYCSAQQLYGGIIMLFLLLFIIVFISNIRVIIDRRKEKRQDIQLRDSKLKEDILTTGIFDAFVIGILVFLFCIFEMHWYNKLLIILLGLLVEGSLVGQMAQWFNPRRFVAWLSLFALTAGGLFGSYAYDQYLRDITVPEYFDYRTYDPFEPDSLAVSLDETPTLQFSDADTLPRLDGATALYPVYSAIAKTVYPSSLADRDVLERIDIIDCDTTPYAYKDLVDGDCDMIFVAGPSEQQEAYAAEHDVKLVYTPIGKEAFVFFVHPDNPVSGLTLSEIRSIYSGSTTRWDQLGVPGLGKIRAYQRDEGSGSQTALERFVMRDTPLMPASTEMRQGGMGDIVEVVSDYQNHRNAIGFSFRFYCTTLMKDFHVKLLAVEGITPTIENIENGTYPLASSFYAVIREDADANTLALLDWICGPQGQKLVEKTGYTPVH